MHRIHCQGQKNSRENKMKSVLNAGARRQLEATAVSLGAEKIQAAAQAIRLRTEDGALAHSPAAFPQLAPGTGKPLANYLAAKRVGDLLYLSGVIAVDPTAGKVITRYADLPPEAMTPLRGLGYCTGQMSVDIFEAPIVAQSWFVLQSIQAIAHEHGAQMTQVFKLVQYFRDLRHYPAYNRVRNLFCPAGVVSTVVEVSRMLPTDEVLIEVEATVSLSK
jgi:2-iminobutanoate/2-iminopropanoate deaminase